MISLLYILGGFTLFFFYWRFFFFLRNPKRIISSGSSCLSPADGVVVYVKHIANGQIPIALKRGNKIPLDEIYLDKNLKGITGYQIGVFMTAFSVHINRIPLSGQVVNYVERKSQRNLSTARLMTKILVGLKPYEGLSEHIVENDRVTLSIETINGVYYLTQIADKWISNIINDLKIDDEVKRGSVFGMIRFGSQVDLFIPDQLGYHPVVRAGDYVFAGRSEIAITT